MYEANNGAGVSLGMRLHVGGHPLDSQVVVRAVA